MAVSGISIGTNLSAQLEIFRVDNQLDHNVGCLYSSNRPKVFPKSQ